MYDAKTRVLLSLFRVQGVGQRFLSFFLTFVEKEEKKGLCIDWNDHGSVLLLMEKFYGEDWFRGKKIQRSELTRSLEGTDSYLCHCMQLNIQIVPRWSGIYPRRMRTDDEAPMFIFVRGNVRLLQENRVVAVIGSRNGTEFSLRVASRLASRFVAHECIVLSGLAKGCDTAAHMGCLQAQGQTIAVLAHGLAAEVYPRSNRSLSEQIVSGGGLLLSEYDIFAVHHKGSFLKRNRIQVALSDGIVVVEGGRRGGTAYTVQYAQEKGCPVGFFWSTDMRWEGPRKMSINKYLKGEGKGLMIDGMPSLKYFIKMLN